jgi:DMSO reductase family type II enzyme heme b subunit
LYTNHCAQCHGDEGDGNGPAARFLYPKPRNFRLAQFRLVTTTNRVPSDNDLLQAITRGMPGSAMFPFSHLPEADRQTLVAYVRHLTRTGLEARLRQAAKDAGEEVDADQLAQDIDRLAKSGTALALPADLPASDAISINRGQALYKAQCATCHGETGKGDGVKEQRDEDGTPTRPRDFTRGIFKGGRDRLQLYARIAIGMPGTPMPSSPHLKPAEIGDMVNYIETMSDPKAQAQVEHKRIQLTVKRASSPFGKGISDGEWASVPAVPLVVSPLWWREYAEPDLCVQALHDGRSIAFRFTWNDATQDDQAARPEDFEDMMAVQLVQGSPEPFLGMGAAGKQLDLWLWRASWTSSGREVAAVASILDQYPFDGPLYKELTKGKEKGIPDFLTARAAGNPHAHADASQSASNLAAQGFGSTTFRPKASQLVSSTAKWIDGRWSVVLKRPLQTPAESGLSLAPGQGCSIAFAIWDGAARDRNGQKLISIWHDMKLD